MADLTITATSVIPGAAAVLEQGIFGETITAGQPVYKAAATQKWMKADTDSATAEVRVATAIAVTGGAVNQYGLVQKSGSITIGATLSAGVAYYLSGTAGGICPVADVAAGDYTQIIGLATSTTVLKLSFLASPTVLA
jgi:hypothetical protein